MRPLPGDEAFTGRSRSTSFADSDSTPLATRSQQSQMTYFLADEKTMESSQSSSHPTAFPKQREFPKSSNYGVESIETTISSLSTDSDDSDNKLRNARHNWKGDIGRQMSRRSEVDLTYASSSSLKSLDDMSRNASPSHQRRSSQATISRPFTPLSFGSPAPPSLMSSPDSRRNSDAGSYMDDVASQAIVSSGDEDGNIGLDIFDSENAPQLVMPSIKMPSRRPFTERGKNMGRLKVLIAGDSGVGKTSLIKAIVQICEDIVHVDPLSSTPMAISDTRRKLRTDPRSASVNVQSTSQITEVYASTRAYPAWWSDLEESRVLRRRKSMGESVLERNLCFVDTPGYGSRTSCLECITPVVDYVESHFKKATSFEGMNESDMTNMLSGNGGSQVDLVLYVIYHKIKPVDIEYLRQLSNLTNVVPLIAQADTLSPEQLASFKKNILSELSSANIRPFLFNLSADTFGSTDPAAPYAISTHPSKDLETMDASLLMSPDYVQPLQDSELLHLVSLLFSPDAISWLRHSAAKKFIHWRASSTPLSKPQALYRPLSMASSPNSSQVMTAPIGATNSFALARITDHTQREEKIAQVRLANWAADLQRSLRNERMRFDALARSERAVWLTERLGECVHDGTIVPISQARQQGYQSFDEGSSVLVKQGTYSRKREREMRGLGTAGVDRCDPLGLLQLNREMKRKGWVVLKVASGLGILGGLAFWALREWVGEDTAIWGFGGLSVRDLIDLKAVPRK